MEIIGVVTNRPKFVRNRTKFYGVLFVASILIAQFLGFHDKFLCKFPSRPFCQGYFVVRVFVCEKMEAPVAVYYHSKYTMIFVFSLTMSVASKVMNKNVRGTCLSV
ncbi:hypothetical protein OS493_019074 [Desmophyllum pertusum]|uniref:Uncharacterized protein n=1 Tax=Desmophyllum pertusum TaxID=174260 RepID=A0A9W9YZZ9_9CNID|nr:hypothetical protein OS493_026049 [Desmophyllum pertusum]KAJ7372562.1 hypothetical protein OS493_019074 [Desmophyllum pertusum]